MTTQKKESKGFQLSIDFFDRPEICAVTVEHGIKRQTASYLFSVYSKTKLYYFNHYCPKKISNIRFNLLIISDLQ